MSNCYQCIQKNKVITDLENKLKISDAACDGMAERWRETENERDESRELGLYWQAEAERLMEIINVEAEQ